MELNVNIKFLNSFKFEDAMGKPPPWAVEIKAMVAELKDKGLAFMAKAEEKLVEIQAQTAATAASLAGIGEDLAEWQAKSAADAEEIAALKQAVIDANSAAGEMSPELSAQFDELIESMKGNAAKAKTIDEAVTRATPAPIDPPVDPAAPTG